MPPISEGADAAYARGRAAYPDLEVSAESFAAYFASCGAQMRDGSSAPIHAEDLYLACACLQGNERAIETLIGSHRDTLKETLSRLDPSPAFVDDVLQRFWDAALVGTMTAQPRIATYSGRGSLAGWLGVGVQRVALMMRRHERAEGRARRFGEGAADNYAADPELAFIKERYRGLFENATQAAMTVLDDRERMIFRLHLVDGVTIERIAQTYGVSHSTISRWFAGARRKIIDEVERVIRAEVQLTPSEFDSLKRLVLSQIDVSLSVLSAS